MSTFIIIIVLILIYFVIVGIKENETREAVDRERRISNKKIANVHFQGLIQNELNKKNVLLEIHEMVIKNLEKEEYISRAFIMEDVLLIEIFNYENDYDVFKFASELANSLDANIGINTVKIFDINGILIASESRKNCF